MKKLTQGPLIVELVKALKLADEMCTYAHGKFNWGASALDAKAIDLLNRAPIAVRKAIAQATEKTDPHP